MRSTLALILAAWRTASSYRLRLAMSIASLAATVIPLYFVANALQPVMAESIDGQGGEYFGFLIVGMVTFLLLPAAIGSLPSEVSSGINTGVLEVLLATPARLRSIIPGMIGFNFLWTGLRASVLMLAGWMLGAELVWSHLASAALILLLIVLAYLPIGMVGAALVICFRTQGPLPQGVLLISSLLGGVYYPTTVIPAWIQIVSDWVPLTYGLRALRQTLLEGSSLAAVLPDVGILIMFVVVLSGVGVVALASAMRYARRAGTLAHY
jgi:ABC-2 type transport system permease protein